MKTFRNNGFTIIETMLFLGITGLLVAGVLVGSGVSLNRQRYRDSITSLQSFIQRKYSDVANVSNDKINNICAGIDLALRGRSECVLLGKIITVNSDGNELLIRNVVGTTPTISTVALNDIDALNSYNPQISNSDSETKKIDWGNIIVEQGSDSVLNFSILIARSPSSGVLRTFIDSEKSFTNLLASGELINENALTKELKLCVSSNGMFNGPRNAVLIVKSSTSASGVETLGDNSGC